MALDEGKEAAMAFLSRPREIDRKIRRTREAIRDTRLALTSISVSYSDMPKGGGGPTSRTEEGIVAIMSLEEKLARLEEERAQVVGEVSGTILRLADPMEQEVLIRLFVECEPWEDIANEMGCSTRTVGIHRKNGINGICRLLEVCE